MHFMSEKSEKNQEDKVMKYFRGEGWEKQIQRLMKNGEAFELIDGENLEFKG